MLRLTLPLLLAWSTLSGCASSTGALDSDAKVPLAQPDDRLMQLPCAYEPVVGADLLTILPGTTKNNQCARTNRERYIELQNWIRGRAQ